MCALLGYNAASSGLPLDAALYPRRAHISKLNLKMIGIVAILTVYPLYVPFRNSVIPSMLVPGDPGRLGTPIYVFTMESPQPVGARNTSCAPLLWKPHDPSRQDTPLYFVTFETSRLLGARNTSCKQLLWKPRDPSRQGAPIYLVTFETSRPMGQGTVHVSSYCGNPAIRAGKAHPFT
jgi:hypothetical protein